MEHEDVIDQRQIACREWRAVAPRPVVVCHGRRREREQCKHLLRQVHYSAAERPLRERVDHEDDKYDGEEDAVDVDVERRRRLLVSRALSFPSVLDGTVHTCVMSSLSSTHSLQERRLD